MGEVEEQKFVCKFCNKICISGKSLGGHMRCHLDLIAAAKKSKVKADNNIDFEDVGADDDHGDSGLEENLNVTGKFSPSQSSENWTQDEGENCTMNLEMEDQYQDQDNHVLRQNPKKSWKNSDLRIKSCQTNGISCRECGKIFPSSRALAGHMRTHSTLYTAKSKAGHNCSKCGRNFDSTKALFGHMKTHSNKSRVSADSDDCLSDFEFYHPKKKRSITRYRTSQNVPFSSEKESLSFNEIDEVDEEAAISLIMLSMGMRDHHGFKFQQESSSNGHSSAFCNRDITKPKSIADDSLYDVDEEESPPTQKLNSCLLFSLNSVLIHNSSEYFYCLDKKTEQENAIDEFLCSNKPNMCSYQLDANKINRPSYFMRGENAIDTDFETFGDSGKKKEYKCKTCNMIFQSHQALGGHSNRHKMMITSSPPNAETYYLWSDNTSNEAQTGNSKMVMTDLEVIRSIKHECEICFKIFPSGKALGGHKRAHYNGLNENRIKEISVNNQISGDIQPILDLNLPVITHLDTNRTDDIELGLRLTEFAHQCEPVALGN